MAGPKGKPAAGAGSDEMKFKSEESLHPIQYYQPN